MAIKSQIRLEQLTGSFGNVSTKNTPGMIRTDSAPKALAAVGATDLSGTLSMIASALGRIHGKASNEALDNVAGTFYQAIVPDSSGGQNIGSATAEWGDLFIADDKKIQLGSDQDFKLFYDEAGINKVVASGSDVQIASTQKLEFFGSEVFVHAPAKGKILVSAAGTTSDAAKINSSGGVDIQAASASEIGLADGLLTLDLNGSDAVDGLLVDAEGSITLDAAVNDSGAIIINASNAGGLTQVQSAGTAKLVVSASQVSIHDQARVQDSTAATSTSSGALIVDGGVGIGLDLYVGDDAFLKSDGSVLNFGLGDDVKFSHNGTTGMNVTSAGVFVIDGANAVDVNAAAGLGMAGQSVILSASGGGINVDATGAVAIESSGGTLSVGADNVAQNISIGTAGARTLIALGSSAATETQIEGTLVDVNWGASGGLFAGAGPAILDSTASAAIISGSLAVALSGANISFSTDGNMTSAGGSMAGNMAFALNHDEFVTFRSKPIFSAGTSIIGAFNALATAAGGGVVGKALITGSAVTSLELKGAGMSSDGGFTQSIALDEATPANTEVYVNGQLLTSGTNGSTQGDYQVKYADPGAVTFRFSLQPDDVVVVKTTAEQ